METLAININRDTSQGITGGELTDYACEVLGKALADFIIQQQKLEAQDKQAIKGHQQKQEQIA